VTSLYKEANKNAQIKVTRILVCTGNGHTQLMWHVGIRLKGILLYSLINHTIQDGARFRFKALNSHVGKSIHEFMTESNSFVGR
jgi:hypothetical protein